MGRFPIPLWLLGTVLVGGVALAQQGLIVEPWRRSAPVQPAPTSTAAGQPKSGVPAAAPPPVTHPKLGVALEPPPPAKWSPPVVELLVDPWAKERVARPARSRWVPENVEIVDPWAEAAPPPPRVASLPGKPLVAPIF